MPSSLSCDSVLYLNLTILGPINGATQQATACNTYQWQGQTYSQSGLYSDTIQTSAGCDSIIHLNLTINNSITGPTIQQIACDSYAWNGQVYTQSGIYTYNGTAQSGCDSTATLELTINYGPTNTLLINNAGTLSASSQNALSFSWLDCSTNSLIPGETGITFIPNSTGSFATIASNNCGSDTSQCIQIEVQGLDALNTQTIVITPNPTNGLITVVTNKFNLQSFQLTDMNGKVIMDKLIESNLVEIDLTDFSDGLYLLKIYNSEKQSTLHRIVKTNF